MRRGHGHRGLKCQVWLFKRPVESNLMRKLLGSVWGTWRGTETPGCPSFSGLGKQVELQLGDGCSRSSGGGEEGKKGRRVEEKGEDK